MDEEVKEEIIEKEPEEAKEEMTEEKPESKPEEEESKPGFKRGVRAGIIGTLIFFVIAIGAGLGAYRYLYGAFPWETSKLLSWKRVEQKMETIGGVLDTYYLDPIDTQAMEDGIYKGMVSSLGDRYTIYYTPEEYQAMKQSDSGYFYGIGILVQMQDDGHAIVVEPYETGSAYEAGVKPGDIISAIEGESTEGMTLDLMVSKMRGKEHTKVEVTFYRPDTKEYLTYKLERRKIEEDTVASAVLENVIGYIAVSSFDEITNKQFREAIEALDEKGIEGLIIDLRNNGGGYVDVAVDMLDRLLPAGIVVYTENKNGVKETYKASNQEQYLKPIVLLVNGGSASATEIFAGAMRDYERATIIGTKTFGKGIVQTIIPMTDGSAIKITESKYYSPKGINIHGTGIEPDIIVEDDPATEYDEQLAAAVKTLKNK